MLLIICVIFFAILRLTYKILLKGNLHLTLSVIQLMEKSCFM